MTWKYCHKCNLIRQGLVDVNEKRTQYIQRIKKMFTPANTCGAQSLPTSLSATERHKLAHELRTSFGVILARVDALLQTSMSKHTEIHRTSYLEEIRLAANHALEVIDKTTSDPDDNATDPLPYTDLYDNVLQAIALVEIQAQDAGVKISIDTLDDPISVRAKPSALRQILINILVNAIKFTPDGGKIDVGISVANQTCTIAIRDNGIGIAPAELARIRNTRSGHGYGYSIANSLAAACGGELSVESQRNVGTTVSLTFARQTS